MFQKKITFIIFIFFSLFMVRAMTVHAADQKQTTATPITTAIVKTSTISVTEESVGRIEARFAPLVSAEETGLVVNIHAGIGQYVEAGELLAQIDHQAYSLAEDAKKADVQRLKSLIANQEKTVKRYQNLLKNKSIPQDRMDSAEVSLATLKDQLNAAIASLSDSKRRKNKTQCTAPVSGWIEKRLVTTGDFVSTGKPLFKITSDEKLRIVLPFPESVASKLKKDQKVLLSTPVSQDAPIESLISKIRPSVNIGSRAIEVIIDIDNPGAWRPGASINGTVVIDTKPNTIMVPDKSIIRRPAGEVVYVVENKTAKERVVKTGIRKNDFIEILDGLKKGETIAVFGAGYLTHNTPVRVQEKNE